MMEIEAGDVVRLFPPCSHNSDQLDWSGREATVLEVPDDGMGWCRIQVHGSVMMSAPVKWLRKKP